MVKSTLFMICLVILDMRMMVHIQKSGGSSSSVI